MEAEEGPEGADQEGGGGLATEVTVEETEVAALGEAAREEVAPVEVASRDDNPHE